LSTRTRNVIAGLGAAALLIPSAAVAAPGKGKAPAKPDVSAKSEKRVKPKKVKTVMYVVKGVYDETGKVDATGGNKHAKRANLVRSDVELDLTKAKLVVADTDGDQQITLADIKAGDKLVVQLKLPRTLGDAPLVARKVVDQTNPPVEEDEAPTTTETQAGAA
jgi:hypothetical protein